jgi:hypothetical protein
MLLQAAQRAGTTRGYVGLSGDSNAKRNLDASYPQEQTLSRAYLSGTVDFSENTRHAR